METESDGKVLKNKIAEYYNYTRRFYRFFWHGNTNALHYGFHDTKTKDHYSALLKTIEMTAHAGGVRQNDIVVDLGCGVGGTAFWIAEYIGAKVEGITLSREQYKKAIKLQKKFKRENLINFKIGDYFQTRYADNYFDAVIGIEALCYGQHNIGALAQELYRITKSGGRLAVTDGYVGKENVDADVAKRIRLFEEGFAIEKMITVDAFMKALEFVGFKEVSFIDWTENVLPTAIHMHRLTKRWYWFTVLMTKLRIIPDLILKNNITGQVQLGLFSERALVYGCITAQK